MTVIATAIVSDDDREPFLCIYDGRELLGEVFEVEGGYIGLAVGGAAFGPFAKPAGAGKAIREHQRAAGAA